jgi:1-acyl-sn-glycerol-3-phosphate acyltransferase
MAADTGLSALQLLQRLGNVIYGVYAILTFLVLGALALVLVTLVPGLGMKRRRAIAHYTARSFFHVAGMRVNVVGEELLPAGPCVVVANHASYIDGVVLKAFLPARFSFVIKKEVTKVPLAGLLLKRIGSEFVDRFNRHAGGMDARRLIKAADARQAHAFLPVVPVAIRGTRYILPSGRLLPRFGHIEIDILPPLPVGTSDPVGVIAVRDQARSRIVNALGEPDLAHDDGVAAISASRKSPPPASL